MWRLCDEDGTCSDGTPTGSRSQSVKWLSASYMTTVRLMPSRIQTAPCPNGSRAVSEEINKGGVEVNILVLIYRVAANTLPVYPALSHESKDVNSVKCPALSGYWCMESRPSFT